MSASHSLAGETATVGVALFGAMIAADDPAAAWLIEHWYFPAVVGALSAAVSFTIQINLDELPKPRILCARVMAAALFGALLAAGIGSAWSGMAQGVYGLGFVGVTAVFAGVSGWMILLSINDGMEEYKRSGRMWKAIGWAFGQVVRRLTGITPPVPEKPATLQAIPVQRAAENSRI